jgi:hypothetical protein
MGITCNLHSPPYYLSLIPRNLRIISLNYLQIFHDYRLPLIYSCTYFFFSLQKADLCGMLYEREFNTAL